MCENILRLFLYHGINDNYYNILCRITYLLLRYLWAKIEYPMNINYLYIVPGFEICSVVSRLPTANLKSKCALILHKLDNNMSTIINSNNIF